MNRPGRLYGSLDVVTANGKRNFRLALEPQVMIRFKRVFPRADQHAHRSIDELATAELARELEWFLERYPLELTANGAAALEELARAQDRIEALIFAMEQPDYRPPQVELAVPARDYQLTPAAMVLATGGLLLGDDVGVGKTASAIVLAAHPGTLPMLFVTLTHLPTQVAQEFARFTPALRVHVIKKGASHDASGQAQDLTQRMVHGVAMPDVVILSYSKIARWADFLAPRVKTVCYDEVQELRSGESTKKGSAAKHLSEKASYRLGMSATPIYNRGTELHSVLGFLTPDALGDYYEFVREWCAREDVVNPEALGAYLRERGVFLRRTRADVKRELPPITHIEQYVDNDPAALDAISGRAAELARFILAGGAGRGDAMKAGGELDWKLREATGISKARYVAEFVRLLVENGERVVLYGWHHAVYAIWKDVLADIAPAFFTGAQTAKEKEEAKRRFVACETPVLIMSLRAGAGVDGLQYVPNARTVVFGELDWSPGVHEQAIGRIARDGQSDPVAAYFLVAEDGSDPIVAEALGVKSFQSRGIRDPGATANDTLATDSSERIRTLAEKFLTSRGLPIPERAASPVPSSEADLMLFADAS